MPKGKAERRGAGMIKRPLLAGALAATAATTPGAADAATDIFLRLDGIQGESTDAKYKDQIDILSYSLGLANSAPVTSSGAAAGKFSCGNMVLTKVLDKSSPTLITYLAASKHIKSGTLTFTATAAAATGAKGGVIEYYVLDLKDLVVTAVQQSEAAGAAKVTEQVTLSAAKIDFQYRQTATTQTAAIDCKAVK